MVFGGTCYIWFNGHSGSNYSPVNSIQLPGFDNEQLHYGRS